MAKKYVDGFVLNVPTKKLAAYKKMATMGRNAWLKHGALEYYEAFGQDMKSKMGIPFPKLAKSKKGETVVFAWIVYKSKKHRDQVNAKVMKEFDQSGMEMPEMPFDCNKMTYGGFDIVVGGEAKKKKAQKRR
jgi:uncharacterized protein YbaA (DUF1428 family)